MNYIDILTLFTYNYEIRNLWRKCVEYIISIERSILSSILFDPELLDDIAIILNKDDFFLKDHQLIFQSMLDLSSEDLPIEETFLFKKLDKVVDKIIDNN